MDKKEMLSALIQHFSAGNKAQFAKLLGITPQTVSTWLTRNTFDADRIFAYCKGVNGNWLLSGRGEMLNPAPTTVPTKNKQRMLEELIGYYADGNKDKFHQMLGVAPQTINEWIARETFDAELIYTKCEGVSGDWLLSGEGPMLKKDMPTSCQPSRIEELLFKLFDEVHKKRKV